MIDDEPDDGELAQHVAYLKGSRQDPLPWDETAGPSTAPLPVLTAPMLAQMDEKVAGSNPDPQEPAQPRLSRMQEREWRKFRRRVSLLALLVLTTLVFSLAFLAGWYDLL